jgi:hypothetical protein
MEDVFYRDAISRILKIISDRPGVTQKELLRAMSEMDDSDLPSTAVPESFRAIVNFRLADIIEKGRTRRFFPLGFPKIE